MKKNKSKNYYTTDEGQRVILALQLEICPRDKAFGAEIKMAG